MTRHGQNKLFATKIEYFCTSEPAAVCLKKFHVNPSALSCCMFQYFLDRSLQSVERGFEILTKVTGNLLKFAHLRQHHPFDVTIL